VAIVGIVVASLSGLTVMSLRSLKDALSEQSAYSAPSLMSLLAERVTPDVIADARALRQVVDEGARIAGVDGCRITTHSADGDTKVFEAGELDGHRDGRHLSQRFPASGDGTSATLELCIAPPVLGGVARSVWTSAGVMAAVALVLVALWYRHLLRQLRPMNDVQTHLLAYDNGVESSLHALQLQSVSSPVERAWNNLISFVDSVQNELDNSQSRASLVESMAGLAQRGSQAILDTLPIGVVRVNQDYDVMYCNFSATRLLPIVGDASGPRRIEDETLRETFSHMCENASSGDASEGLPVDFRRSVGRNESVIRLTPIRTADAPANEMVVIAQDVSQLVEAEKSRDAFLSHVSHELRTPLTNIRAYAETLTEDFFDDEQTRRECYNVITQETSRLSRLIEDVLNVSKIEAGSNRAERSPLRIDQSLRQAVQDIQATFDAKSVDLRLSIPSKAPVVLADRHRLHQVWINLLGNAVKYTPSGGSVDVRLERADSRVRVEVADTGIGIPADEMERVFDKFYRVRSNDVEQIEGTGLGLYITRDIVRDLDGDVTVTSEQGKGTVFTVELPIERESSRSSRNEVAHGADRGS
jgi:two-component system phosphate regulon sensor histidine kinase PhoR